MSVRLVKEMLGAAAPVRAVPQQIMAEGEIMLPGGLRDEVRILYAGADVVPHLCEAASGRVNVSGKVDFHILYAQGDLTRVKSAETRTDFSRALTVNVPADGARYTPLCEVNHLSHRVFNGRVLLQAEINVYAEAAAAQEIQAVTALEEADAQTLKRTVTVQQPVGDGETQALIRGEFEVSDVLQATEALIACAQARVEDIIGGADGKATVTGTVDIAAYLASSMPGRPVVCSQHSVPFEETVTLGGEMGDMLSAEAFVTDTAAALEGDESGRVLRVETGITIRMLAIRQQEISILTDAFFTEAGDALPETENVSFCTEIINEQAAESARVQIVLPESAPRIKTVLCAFAHPQLAGAREQNGKMTVDLTMHTTLLYMTEDSGIPLSYSAEEPMRLMFSCAAQAEDMLRLSASHVEAATVATDRAEVRCVVTLHASGARYEAAQAVTHIERDEKTALQHTLALYVTQPDERLWDVMKRYRLTESAVKAMNAQAAEYAVDQPLPLFTRLIAYRR